MWFRKKRETLPVEIVALAQESARLSSVAVRALDERRMLLRLVAFLCGEHLSREAIWGFICEYDGLVSPDCTPNDALQEVERRVRDRHKRRHQEEPAVGAPSVEAHVEPAPSAAQSSAIPVVSAPAEEPAIAGKAQKPCPNCGTMRRSHTKCPNCHPELYRLNLSCPACGELNGDHRTFCIGCGTQVRKRTCHCSHCGAEKRTNAQPCPVCGKGGRQYSIKGEPDTPEEVAVKQDAEERTKFLESLDTADLTYRERMALVRAVEAGEITEDA